MAGSRHPFAIPGKGGVRCRVSCDRAYSVKSNPFRYLISGFHISWSRRCEAPGPLVFSPSSPSPVGHRSVRGFIRVLQVFFFWYPCASRSLFKATVLSRPQRLLSTTEPKNPKRRVISRKSIFDLRLFPFVFPYSTVFVFGALFS